MKDPAKLEARCQSMWGISHRQYMTIRAEFGHAPFQKFNEQRYHAKHRNIAFKLSFMQWWDLWQSSGHWIDRGQHYRRNFVMARTRDLGAYEIGNVRITTTTNNMREYHREHGKLNEEKVKEIRALYKPYDKTFNMTALGSKYGVSRETIQDVLSFKTWTSVI